MPEITCAACNGYGQVSVPHAEIDENGNPVIMHVISACIACAGNGKVQV